MLFCISLQCTLCGKKFGYKNGLIRHVRLTHVGEKPYQCNICQRRFGYKHILMEHQNLHFGNRPYACNMCDKKFAARSNLIQHRTVHKRPFNCSMCNKRFDREDQLKKHLFAHPQALLTCNFCQYAATSQADLNKHMVDHHPPQVIDTRGPASVKSESGEEQEKMTEGDSDVGKSPAASSGSGDYADRDVVTPQLMTHAIPPLNSPPPIQSVEHSSSQSQSLSVHTTPLPSPQHNTIPPMSQFSPRSISQALESRGSKVDTICSHLSTSVSSVPLPNQSSPSYTGPLPCPTNHSTPPISSYSNAPSNQIPPTIDAYKGVIVKKEVEDYLDTSCSRQASFPSPVDHIERHSSTSPRTPSRQSDDLASPVTPHTPMYSSADLMRSGSIVPPSPSYSTASSNFPPASGAPSFGSSFGTSGTKTPNPPSIPTLPAIHEVFSRRAQRIPPTFANFGVPAMLSPDRLNVNVPHISELPISLLSPPATTSTFSSSSSSSLTLPTLSSSQSSNRPMAQLPPIAQVLKQPKDTTPQHTTQFPGMPPLDEILSYYINQGKLFKCQHCNILFYERGMYFLHASLHGQSSPWECSICHKVCMDKNEFTIHFVNQQHTSL